ncbi:hypothetical protein CapIbe_007086 [Capra ibex]
MGAIPSSGSLVATHDYCQSRLGSTSMLESPEQSESAPASTGMITYDLAREAAGKQQPGSQPGKTNCSPCPE